VNATFFFNNLAKQSAEFARLQRTQSIDFIGLYGDACALAGTELSAAEESCWTILTACGGVHACPSAAARRRSDGQKPGPKDKLIYQSLPAMLMRLGADPAAQSLNVVLQTDSVLARVESLELCLAALALDWQVALSLSGEGINGLMHTRAQPGAKGFASLSMYGLKHAFVSPKDIQNLAINALTLPWLAAIAPEANLTLFF
jgi:hypothetical protein